MLSAEERQSIHNCRRVLRMAAELHVRGYQRLRIVPHLYELGTWRCGITPVTNVRRDHGALAQDWDSALCPQHTSASERECFGWKDASHATPSRLAEMFLQRYPAVAGPGFGADWEYAGWFNWMLHETWPDCLPITMGAGVEVPAGGMLTIGQQEKRLQSPPAGRWVASD